VVLEARIACAFPVARAQGKRLRDVVMIDALRKLRRDAKASVALVQIPGAGSVFEIFGEIAIVVATRPNRGSWTLTRFEPVTGFHFAQWTFRIRRDVVPVAGVDREAVRCPA